MRFREEFAFLSNFHPAEVSIETGGGGKILLPSVEVAYQASKTLNPSDRQWIMESARPGEAKQRGKGVILRPDWKLIQVNTMRELVYQKFATDDLGLSELATRLSKVEGPIVEHNTWHDTFWGVCIGGCKHAPHEPIGENVLGRLLEEARSYVQWWLSDVVGPYHQDAAATGHRPGKLGGYSKELRDQLDELAYAAVLRLRPRKGISGMALGWDQSWARALIRAKVRFVAAVPFEGQELRWKPEQQDEYFRLLGLADEIVYTSEGGYSPGKPQIRNEWMVDHCRIIPALWNKTGGGTKNCIDYARKVHVPVWNLWKAWEERGVR